MDQLFQRIASDVVLGRDVKIWAFVNLYGCEIGDESMIGAYVEIQSGAKIGRRCRIQSHSFVCEGVTIQDDVFVGHGVMFINDAHPQAVNAEGRPQTREDWSDRLQRTVVKRGVSIGSNATILGGITIGEHATVGAGAVVTKDVAVGMTVVGNPARILEKK